MILRDIYLYPDLVEHDLETRFPFQDQTRSLCNYLERRLKPLKFKIDGFNRICFICKSKPNDGCFVDPANALGVEIGFVPGENHALKEDQLNDYFIGLLTKGILKCQKHYDIPGTELLEWMEDFRNEDYINKWTHKRRQFRSHGIKCALECELTLAAFHLNLVVTKGKAVLYQSEIAKSPPDEVVFLYLLKDVKMIDDVITVIGKLDDTIFELDVNQLEL